MPFDLFFLQIVGKSSNFQSVTDIFVKNLFFLPKKGLDSDITKKIAEIPTLT